MNSKIDSYFISAEKWQAELQALRTIILNCGLTEELKWNVPCYTFKNNNIVGINGLKDYCAIGFFKGGIMDDPFNVLVQPGKHSQAGRMMRFNSLAKINEQEDILKTYIYRAIEIENSGLKVKYKKPDELDMPEEFQQKLVEMPMLKNAFEALTPGRQKAYIFYFSAPKQSKTREARIENYIPQILSGKGMNDR